MRERMQTHGAKHNKFTQYILSIFGEGMDDPHRLIHQYAIFISVLVSCKTSPDNTVCIALFIVKITILLITRY